AAASNDRSAFSGGNDRRMIASLFHELNWVRPEKRCFARAMGSLHLPGAVIRTRAGNEHPNPSPIIWRRRGRLGHGREKHRRMDKSLPPHNCPLARAQAHTDSAV